MAVSGCAPKRSPHRRARRVGARKTMRDCVRGKITVPIAVFARQNVAKTRRDSLREWAWAREGNYGGVTVYT